MPDNKLLANVVTNGKSSKKVITWTIDRIEDVYEALYHNVDGIITNKPIEILNILQKDYDKFCI
jgi:glycerophosphoryl diester phosphodiesterase